MHDVKSTDMLLSMDNYTSTTHVAPTSNHNNISGIKFHEVNDFSLLQIKLDRVIHFDKWIGISDSSAIVSDNVWYTTCTKGNLLHFAKLVRCLLGGDAMDRETTLDVVKKTEVFVGLVNRNNVHETCRVCLIRADLSIDFDKALFHDLRYFSSIQSVFKPIAEKDGEGKGFPEFMGTR